MIPKVSRGGSMGGLMAYLAGPGKDNEHALPHVIAGSSGVELEALTRESGREVAAVLDVPRRAHETAVLVKGKPAHVWHCSLSLSPDEPALEDAKWQKVAEGFVDRMGFAEDCRWVAVRHGLSKAGGDHVHVVVNLVREDGTPADVWRDRPRAQEVSGELEREHGLQVLESREAGIASRGYNAAEVGIAQRAGKVELPKDRLERVVRGAAALAGDEAEFVRLLHRQDVKATPRMRKGSRQVAGYSYALPDSANYGGGRLAKDLALPRLRERWQAPVGTVDGLQERLARIPSSDLGAWANVAHEASGALSAWSLAAGEGKDGPLAQAADDLGRHAQARAYVPRPSPLNLPLAGAAVALSLTGDEGKRIAEAMLVMRAVMLAAQALHDRHRQQGNARLAAELAGATRGHLKDAAELLARQNIDLEAPAQFRAPALDRDRGIELDQ